MDLEDLRNLPTIRFHRGRKKATQWTMKQSWEQQCHESKEEEKEELNISKSMGVCLLLAQSCPTLHDPTDPCSPPGSSVHGILQARILEWVAISFSKGFSWPRDRTWVSSITGRFFTIWATRETPQKSMGHRVLKFPLAPGNLVYISFLN